MSVHSLLFVFPYILSLELYILIKTNKFISSKEKKIDANKSTKSAKKCYVHHKANYKNRVKTRTCFATYYHKKGMVVFIANVNRSAIKPRNKETVFNILYSWHAYESVWDSTQTINTRWSISYTCKQTVFVLTIKFIIIISKKFRQIDV